MVTNVAQNKNGIYIPTSMGVKESPVVLDYLSSREVLPARICTKATPAVGGLFSKHQKAHALPLQTCSKPTHFATSRVHANDKRWLCEKSSARMSATREGDHVFPEVLHSFRSLRPLPRTDFFSTKNLTAMIPRTKKIPWP